MVVLQGQQSTLGLVGLGAFGQLIAKHLAPHVTILGYDPAAPASIDGVLRTDLAAVARCPVVVLATPVKAMADVVAAIAPLVTPGALVVDVGSVKVGPAEIMRRGLPEHVDIVGTHPLFGPQSARGGLHGRKIAVCPVRGRGGLRLAAALRKRLRLEVILTTPDAHDREAATVQGLTHLIARVLLHMEPRPTRMTTASFDLLAQAVDMVRDDAPEVFEAIVRTNPYASGVRRQFLRLASDLDAALSAPAMRE